MYKFFAFIKRLLKRSLAPSIKYKQVVFYPSTIFRILRDRKEWLRQGGIISDYYLIASDFADSAGVARGQYFHQDLLVASYIYEKNPRRHVDIGSRIDGFAAHVASFRQLEVVDIRPIDTTQHKNLLFKQANFMGDHDIESTDSLSCLHALEHFGLGRYTDPIDVNGHVKGIRNLISLLECGGTLYLSVPIGRKDSVFFNAHRVFHPNSILTIPDVMEKLTLIKFDYIDDNGDLVRNSIGNLSSVEVNNGCGIYTFRKL